jgi:hypothetical protein
VAVVRPLPTEIRQLIAGMVIHDRDSIFSSELEELQTSFGLQVLRTPVRGPKANAYCDRLVGTGRRECLDFMNPMSEGQVPRILRPWVEHHNKDDHTPAWVLECLRTALPAYCQLHGHTGTSYPLIVRFERGIFCMVCITNLLGKTGPHNARRRFCGAQLPIANPRVPAYGGRHQHFIFVREKFE